jgi:hypothetical protein
MKNKKGLIKLNEENNQEKSIQQPQIIQESKLLMNKINDEKTFKNLNSKFTNSNSNSPHKQNSNLNISLYSQASIEQRLPTNSDQIIIYGTNYENIEKTLKLGNTYNFFYINDYSLCSIGPNYFYPLILFIFNLIIYEELLLIIIKNKEAKLLIFLFKFSYLNYIFSHLIIFFLNPGIPSKNYIDKIINEYYKIKEFNNLDLNIKLKICKNCNLITKIKDNIKHCKICGICYFNKLSHIKWIGHCVANNNQIIYYFFLCALTCFYLFGFSIIIVNILYYFYF